MEQFLIHQPISPDILQLLVYPSQDYVILIDSSPLNKSNHNHHIADSRKNSYITTLTTYKVMILIRFLIDYKFKVDSEV